MKDKITISIFRKDPASGEEGKFVDYEVPVR